MCENEKMDTQNTGLQVSFQSKEPICKGWSNDKKYRVTSEDGTPYLLRISPIEQYEKKKVQFERMKRLDELRIPMCRPVEFGVCEEGVYSLQSWIEGEDLRDVLPLLSETEQMVLGRKAGAILRTIHTLPAPETQQPWEPRFNDKIDRKIKGYEACPLRLDGAELLIGYINENRHLLKDRPQSYQHGDYHDGNMMLSQGELVIIDFDRDDYGDPWEEFNRIVWCGQNSPYFATGMVDGYFDEEVPELFWRLLALYIASNTLGSIYWAIPYGQSQIDVMLAQAKDVLSWYDGMTKIIPSWYRSEDCLQYAGGIPCRLKSRVELSFLEDFGKIFKIYDGQDSGNLCLGAEKDGERYFVKIAGLPTVNYSGTAADAIARLKATVPIYEALYHSHLIEFVSAKEIGGGFAVVFRWTDGVCMGRMYPQAHQKFVQLPMDDKLRVFDDILDFFEYLAEEGYLAVDFYDGSILYDFEQKETKICDIDFYRKIPTVNDMGRMWGSSRFQAPEEYELGAMLDQVTNVYTLGATAFALFSEYDRKREAWPQPLNDKQYAVVQKAVSADRSARQQSIAEFVREWRAAGSFLT